jgi:DNA-binding SARP family transcriptional activator
VDLEIQIGMLGSMTAAIDGTSVLPTAAKPRQILAVLALNAGQAVQTSALVEELWSSRPPRSAPTTLQTYVLQLRRRLAEATPASGPAAKDVLVTSSGGYLLAISPAQTDVGRFEAALPRGQQALAADDDHLASEVLGQALKLWRGPLAADLPHGRRLELEAMRLEENRLGALELRIAADMRLGRHAALLGELTALAGEYPMHEHLHGQLMLALCRAGRTGESLEVYRRLRCTLVNELGLEPTEHVRLLHQQILRCEPPMCAPGGIPQRIAMAS